MSTFTITGGCKLKGEITPQGAKNEALQILCATLLTQDKITVSNIPLIRDVIKLIDLLRCMGVSIESLDPHTFTFQAKEINVDYLQSEDFEQKTNSLRGSVMIAGPLLARIGYAVIPQPGGDKIGRRRLDTHFTGFEKLGAIVNYNPSSRCFRVQAKHLKGASMLLDEASVTGTANIIMAAVHSEGLTTIFNAACEPYILQLCRLLNNMGAKIKGVGSNLLQIEGVNELHGTCHELLPDMIEIGSFIGMAAMTRSELTIRNAKIKYLGLIPHVFRKLGIHIESKEDDLFIAQQDHYAIENTMDGS
ncbi:MAG: UDP-N-acetylglucosamine 1-carboxyvinyltransferase, partial [Bacteroidales bacterium]